MSRQNVLALVLYHMAVSLKRRDFSKYRRKKYRENLIVRLSAMQVLTQCIGMKSLYASKLPSILSLLRETYEYETEELYELLTQASEDADFSASYEKVLFQMQEVLFSCISELVQKKKGYLERTKLYITEFHNLPRAFLSVTDRSKISPDQAIEYSAPYLNQIKTQIDFCVFYLCPKIHKFKK